MDGLWALQSIVVVVTLVVNVVVVSENVLEEDVKVAVVDVKDDSVIDVTVMVVVLVIVDVNVDWEELVGKLVDMVVASVNLVSVVWGSTLLELRCVSRFVMRVSSCGQGIQSWVSMFINRARPEKKKLKQILN